jgi:hypothetical protein
LLAERAGLIFGFRDEDEREAGGQAGRCRRRYASPPEPT